MRNRSATPGRKKAQGPVRVALYLRVSTAQQIEGYGLQVQEDGCRKRLDSVYGAGNYEVAVFTDGAVSGKLANRPDLDEMNRRIAEGDFDVACFGKLDRIGRTMRNIHRWVYDTTDLGVRVLTGDGRIDSDDDMFGIVMSLLAFMAELEHTLILERTMSGREKKIQAGGWPSGVPPYGLALSGKGKDATPVFNEDEVHVINRAVAHIVDDEQTREETARLLNAHGDRRRSGKLWDGDSVARLLSSSHLLEGVVQFRKTDGRSKTRLGEDGEPLYGPTLTIPVPRILDSDRAAALAGALKERAQEHRASEQYPLSKRIMGSCGKAYVGAHRPGGRMYRCQGNVDNQPCKDVYLDADAVEAGVWSELSTFLQDPERLRSMVEEWAAQLPGSHDKYTERVESLTQQVADAQSALSRAIVNCAKLGLDEEATKNATDSLQVDLSALRGSLREAEAWLADYDATQARAQNMIALMRSANGRMQGLNLARQAEIFEIFDIRVTPSDHRHQRRSGRKCAVMAWHVETGTPVPADPDDEAWSDVRDILLDINPEMLRGRYDHRQALSAMLHRLRTGATWDELDGAFGVSRASLKRAQGAWFSSGAWEVMMTALSQRGESMPVHQPPVVPNLAVRGVAPTDLLHESASDQTVFSKTRTAEAGLSFELAVS